MSANLVAGTATVAPMVSDVLPATVGAVAQLVRQNSQQSLCDPAGA